MVLRATIEDVKCIGRFPFAEGMPQREPRQVIHPTSRSYRRLALSRRDLRSYGRQEQLLVESKRSDAGTRAWRRLDTTYLIKGNCRALDDVQHQ